jgi:hypothetical protein
MLGKRKNVMWPKKSDVDCCENRKMLCGLKNPMWTVMEIEKCYMA